MECKPPPNDGTHFFGNIDEAWSEAWSCANVAAAIARQRFLPDEQHPWVHRQRAMLGRVWQRALLTLSTVSTGNGE